MAFEFVFTGDTFAAIPDWYRIDENVIDLVSLCQKVSFDAGSDILFIARKVNSGLMVVEIRGLRRTVTNPLTQGQINNFVLTRKDIVDSVNIGREYRNEPTSNVVIGGMKNTNYVALPSDYDQSMHVVNGTRISWTYTDINGVTKSGDNNFASANGAGIAGCLANLNAIGAAVFRSPALVEDYSLFPSDIKVRLLGGDGVVSVPDYNGNNINNVTKTFNVKSGSIFPCWGFTPDDHAYPLIEPFLSLDHLVFNKLDDKYSRLTEKIPVCQISVGFFPVRTVTHQPVFLSYDGDSDNRPFAYLEQYFLAPVCPQGFLRGLPLNTEVLRAALSGQAAFEMLYRIYYPDIANALGFPGIKWGDIQKIVNSSGGVPDLSKDINIVDFICDGNNGTIDRLSIPVDADGRILKRLNQMATQVANTSSNANVLASFRTVIYQEVRQYALDHMGRKFLVCLPKSNIMNRIWNGLPVPTRPERPQIEYIVDSRGYWEYVPPDFDGIQDESINTIGNFARDQEDQIRRKFMFEDGRFGPMVVMDWAPKGNINFNSNGNNKAMFQDLPASEFRPNRIAGGNPNYVCISCNVNSLVKRPDLALVEIPCAVQFDPLDGFFADYERPVEYANEFLATKNGIGKFFWYQIKGDNLARSIFRQVANAHGMAFTTYASKVINKWVNDLYEIYNKANQLSMSTEFVMDLKAVIIPLTSTWVSYGPWYYNSSQAKGMVRIDVDESLVPWNFPRVSGYKAWDYYLNIAGIDKLANSLSPIDYVDSASISVAGFPEFGPGQQFGYNSNLTGIYTDFGVNGVKTTYNFATYNARPGTFRKYEYDNIARARIDTREKLPDTQNLNVRYIISPSNEGTNRFTS
jgi:hypothetical protein